MEQGQEVNFHNCDLSDTVQKLRFVALDRTITIESINSGETTQKPRTHPDSVKLVPTYVGYSYILVRHMFSPGPQLIFSCLLKLANLHMRLYSF